tara:strand:+ start:2450 stop:2656 length:207 start_codon:yes stop_codon:yes gene_type:complete
MKIKHAKRLVALKICSFMDSEKELSAIIQFTEDSTKESLMEMLSFSIKKTNKERRLFTNLVLSQKENL